MNRTSLILVVNVSTKTYGMKNLLNKQHHLRDAQMISELKTIACVNLISIFLIQCFAYYLHC